MECIQIYIFDEPAMKEKNMGDIRRRISATFKNRQFRTSVERSGDRNWLNIDVGEAFDEILNFLNTLDQQTLENADKENKWIKRK